MVSENGLGKKIRERKKKHRLVNHHNFFSVTRSPPIQNNKKKVDSPTNFLNMSSSAYPASWPMGAPAASQMAPMSTSDSTATWLYGAEQKAWPYVWLFLGFVLMVLLVVLGIYVIMKVIKGIKHKKKQDVVVSDYDDE